MPIPAQYSLVARFWGLSPGNRTNPQTQSGGVIGIHFH